MSPPLFGSAHALSSDPEPARRLADASPSGEPGRGGKRIGESSSSPWRRGMKATGDERVGGYTNIGNHGMYGFAPCAGQQANEPQPTRLQPSRILTSSTRPMHSFGQRKQQQQQYRFDSSFVDTHALFSQSQPMKQQLGAPGGANALTNPAGKTASLLSLQGSNRPLMGTTSSQAMRLRMGASSRSENDENMILNSLYENKTMLSGDPGTNLVANKMGSQQKTTTGATGGIDKFNDSNSMPISSMLEMMREDDSQQKELLKKETAHIAQMFQKHFDAIREQLRESERRVDRACEFIGEIDKRLSDHAGVMADILDRSKKFETTTTEILSLSSIIKSMHDNQQQDRLATHKMSEKSKQPAEEEAVGVATGTGKRIILTRSQQKNAGAQDQLPLEKVLADSRNAKRRRVPVAGAAEAACEGAAPKKDDDQISGIVIAKSLSRQQFRLKAFTSCYEL